MAKEYSGCCFCGAVGFTLTGEPLQVSWCHCRDCRRQTGAPAVVWAGFEKVALTWSGNLASRRSSEKVTRSFCAECGTPIAYEDDRLAGEIYIHAGLFDQADRLVPDRHAYTTSKLFWIHLEDGLERFDATTRGRPEDEQPG